MVSHKPMLMRSLVDSDIIQLLGNGWLVQQYRNNYRKRFSYFLNVDSASYLYVNYDCKSDYNEFFHHRS